MISFIIPTLNEEKVLGKTLEYLSRYSGAKEIIITDGNSTDKTLEIAKKYTDKIVVHAGPERQTIGGGKNDGAAMAKGDYLVFVDADVCIPDADQFFAKAFALFNNDRALGGLTVAYKVWEEYATLADKIVFHMVALMFVLVNNVFKVGGSGGEFQMVKKEIFDKIKGFDAKLVVTEDNDLFQRVAKVSHTRCEIGLTVFHTGRRAHKIGWPMLLYQWFVNYISMMIFKKSIQDEWVEIR
jgi:glycosyltransferase involved in cell wall biosynthesis